MITPETFAEKKEAFRKHFEKLVSQYDITVDRYATDLDARRIAYLCWTYLVHFYGHEVGFDANYQFYCWAYHKQLRCGEIWHAERDKRDHKKDKPYADPQPLLDNVHFDAFIKIAESLVGKKREPLCFRSPVCHVKIL